LTKLNRNYSLFNEKRKVLQKKEYNTLTIKNQKTLIRKDTEEEVIQINSARTSRPRHPFFPIKDENQNVPKQVPEKLTSFHRRDDKKVGSLREKKVEPLRDKIRSIQSKPELNNSLPAWKQQQIERENNRKINNEKEQKEKQLKIKRLAQDATLAGNPSMSAARLASDPPPHKHSRII